jgi:CBS domain-containing protein
MEPAPHFPAVVRELMTVGVTICSLGTPVTEVARLMVEKNLEVVLVLDEEGNAFGYASQDELVRALTHPDWQSLKVEDFIREGIPEIPADIPIMAAAQIMRDRHTRVLFFMHHAGGIAYPAGILTYRHILRWMAACSADELKDLGIQADRQSPLDAFIQRRDAARRKNNPFPKGDPLDAC